MKKLLIPFIASFGLSLGIATGIVMVRAPKPVVLANTDKVIAPTQKPDTAGAAKDSATAPAADPAKSGSAVTTVQTANANTAGTTGADISTGAPASAGAAATPSTSHEVPPAQDKATKSSQPASATRAPNVKLASNAGATSKSVVPTVRPATDSLIGRRLAQVFGAMQPKDAARVLEQMDDNDVRAILGSLSSKQQAAILGSFPTQRAALILQATLRTASSGGTE